MKNVVPRGERVKAVIKQSGIPVSVIAKKIKKTRSTIHLWFHEDDLDFEKIKEIGDAINYDFSADFPQMKIETPWLTADNKDVKIKELQDKVDFFTDEALRLSKAYKQLEEKYNILLAQQNGNLSVAAEPLESWEKKKGA
jgi:hypothetical protein